MPTDAETVAAKTLQMGGKTSADSTGGLVIPRFRMLPMPEKINKAFPELQQWNIENNEALEQWRQQTNTAINRSFSQMSKALQDQINAMQTTIETMQATIVTMQQDIDDLTP